jgi:hypothetical protein
MLRAPERLFGCELGGTRRSSHWREATGGGHLPGLAEIDVIGAHQEFTWLERSVKLGEAQAAVGAGVAHEVMRAQFSWMAEACGGHEFAQGFDRLPMEIRDSQR